FGAKYGIGNFGLLAINLSRKAGAPVRMVLDRREEHVSSGNRPSSIQRLKVGARRDGALTACQLVSAARRGGGAVGVEKLRCSRRRKPNADAGPVKRGVGMAQSQWVSVIHPPTACEVR